MAKKYFTRKRPLIFNFVAIIFFCALFLAVFAPLCLFPHPDTDFDTSDNCLFSVHSFNPTDLIFPLISVFALIVNVIIIEGFILPPFKPPRFCVQISSMAFNEP